MKSIVKVQTYSGYGARPTVGIYQCEDGISVKAHDMVYVKRMVNGIEIRAIGVAITDSEGFTPDEIKRVSKFIFKDGTRPDQAVVIPYTEGHHG